jgi:hypothetical protein
MHPLRHVHLLQKLSNLTESIHQIRIFVQFYLILFQRPNEPLTNPILRWLRFRRTTHGDAMVFQLLDVIRRQVLSPMITVVNTRLVVPTQGTVQRSMGQLTRQVWSQVPPANATTEDIYQDCQIHKFATQFDERDVCGPYLVELRRRLLFSRDWANQRAQVNRVKFSPIDALCDN